MTTWLMVQSTLEKHGLKRDGDQWRCNNPWRGGSDGMSFRIKVASDGEHGTYTDFMSEEKGSLYDLAEKIGNVARLT